MAHDGIREFVQPVSRAAKEAHLRSVQTESRVGAMGFAGSGDAPALFRENELLIGAEHVDAIDELTGMFGGRAVRPRPFPPRPSELGPPARDLRQVEPPPDSVRVVFSEPPRVRDAAAIFDRAASRSTDSSPPHFSSEMAASVAALVASIDVPRESVGLNHLVEPAGLNMLFTTEAPVTEWGQSDPQRWPAFSGPARIVEAWQLVDSYRAGNGGTALTTLAVMDRGFWFDAAGQPLRHPGQTGSDFDRGVFTYNIDKDNRDISESSSNHDWHGNGAASLAAATVNNQQGAAGAGGTVAFPVLMKHGGDIFSAMRGIKVCGLWGIDVVSMSFGVGPQTIWDYFPDSDWVNAFQYAVDRDVVIVVAAGNSAYRLPDEWVRPATRTPGVITVGALAADNFTARGDSNYGPSVTLWAPGTLLPVMPGRRPPNRHAHVGDVGRCPAGRRYCGDAASSRPVDLERGRRTAAAADRLGRRARLARNREGHQGPGCVRRGERGASRRAPRSGRRRRQPRNRSTAADRHHGWRADPASGRARHQQAERRRRLLVVQHHRLLGAADPSGLVSQDRQSVCRGSRCVGP